MMFWESGPVINNVMMKTLIIIWQKVTFETENGKDTLMSLLANKQNYPKQPLYHHLACKRKKFRAISPFYHNFQVSNSNRGGKIDEW